MAPKSIPSKQIHSQTLNSTIETLQKGVKYSKLTIKTSERRQWCRSGIVPPVVIARKQSM